MSIRMQDLGSALPSGAPRIVPTDRNGIPASIRYFESPSNGLVSDVKYHEEYIAPSGVIYGATGRKNSYGVVNVGQFKRAAFYLDVTDMTRDDSDETLDVILETSYNQGNTWTRFAQFKQIDTEGAQTQVLVVEPSGDIGILTNADSTDPGSGKVSTDFFGDRIRAAGVFTDAAGADSSGVYSVYGIFKD